VRPATVVPRDPGIRRYAADEVEVRLTPTDEGATLLELEHATTSDTAPDGSVDALIGVGVGWELAMDYLRRYLVGTLP